MTCLVRPLLPALSLLFALAPSVARAQILGTPQALDSFGIAAATGDFNGDGRADLAFGVFGDQVSGVTDAGAVNVVYGAAGGLIEPGNQLWHQDSPGIEGDVEEGDIFGLALAAGDFDGDGFADLAVGAPKEDVGVATDAGAVNVLYGSPAGLAAAGNQYWVNGDFAGQTSETGDFFGAALAAGDFDGDGFADLAIGMPNENVGAVPDGGAALVAYGTAAGLSATDAQVWTQTLAMAGTTEAEDLFGTSLAAGDFDDNGFDDLAIGIPQEAVDGQARAGGVAVLYGTGSGLSSAASQLWTQGVSGVPGTPEPVDYFGFALDTGDFDGDGFRDLAIGVPQEDVGAATDAGAVTVLYGTGGGLGDDGSQLWTQDVSGVPGASEEFDLFGRSGTTGDFDGDGFDDLAVGAPGENGGEGATTALYGSASRLTSGGSQTWLQGDGGFPGTGEPDDYFGFALAAGDLDGDGRDDLAVGVPGEAVSGQDGAGAAYAIYGGAGGLAVDGNQYLHQGAPLPTAGEPGVPEAPAFTLRAPYPNPTTGTATLTFTLPAPGPACLAVYDALGREVAVLVDGERAAGPHEVVFDSATLPAGVYLVRFEAGGQVETQRLVRQR